jgi:lysylphosphatidylglycerol synthetase-like protein (DUF2156 family)
MDNLWLKIKIWTKIAIFSVAVIYLLIFVYNNSEQDLTIWFWFGHEIKTSMLVLIPVVLLAGVIGTVVVRMAYRAVRQFRELRQRTAAAKMQQDVEELKSKAASMQTRPESDSPASNV